MTVCKKLALLGACFTRIDRSVERLEVTLIWQHFALRDSATSFVKTMFSLFKVPQAQADDDKAAASSKRAISLSTASRAVGPDDGSLRATPQHVRHCFESILYHFDGKHSAPAVSFVGADASAPFFVTLRKWNTRNKDYLLRGCIGTLTARPLTGRYEELPEVGHAWPSSSRWRVPAHKAWGRTTSPPPLPLPTARFPLQICGATLGSPPLKTVGLTLWRLMR